jgi:transcriptional regulator with XRE-family HTH domain
MTKLAAMEQFAQQLKSVIDASGLTLAGAAAKLGMDAGNLSKIVNGKEEVTLKRANRIANGLGFTLELQFKKNRKMVMS